MNKADYKKKRSALLEEAEELLNQGNVEEYEEKEKEIKELDNKAEQEAIQNANFNALNGKNGPSKEGSQIISGGENVKDKVILNKNDKWGNRVGKPENQRLNLGKYLKGAVTGNWENAMNEYNNLTTTSSGVLIPESLSARIIDKARAKSLFTQAGVPVIPMDTNNLTIGKIKTDPQMEFKAEGVAASESTMELEGVKLESKTAYGYAYITLEAIQSARNLDDVVVDAFSNALAQVIDVAFLYGQADGSGGYDSFAPAGIFNNSDIESVAAASPIVDYDGIIKAISKVKQNNADAENIVWGFNAKTEEIYNLLKNAEGTYYQEPQMVEKIAHILSNQLEHDATDGSKSVVFDPAAMAIGMQNNISVKIMEGTDEGVQKGKVALRIYAMVDAKLLQPGHVCKITGIKA